MITAKLIGSNVRTSDYLKQEFKRGDRGYSISRSDLCDIGDNAHKWRAGATSEATDATDWGSLVDAMLFGEFSERYLILPETYQDEKGNTKPWSGNSNVCKAVKADAEKAGLVPVKRYDADAAANAVDRLRDDWNASEILDGAKTQVLVRGEYVDRATGIVIPLRALLDIVPDAGPGGIYSKSLCDLKCVADAEPRTWGRKVLDYDWHTQSAFHGDLYRAATGEDRTEWLHLVQESKPPYEIGRRHLSAEFVQLGRSRYMQALAKYCRCLSENRWPGYDDGNAGDPIDGWTFIEPDAWMVDATMSTMDRLVVPEEKRSGETADIVP